MSEDIVENLKQPAQWIRIAYMIALAVALYLAGMVLTLLIVAQALFGLLTGADNRNLRDLGAALSQYVRQVLDFLTYNSEFKPFPFTPFPGADVPVSQAEDEEMAHDEDVEVHAPEGADPVPPQSQSAPRPARRRAPSKKAAKPQDDTDGD